MTSAAARPVNLPLAASTDAQRAQGESEQLPPLDQWPPKMRRFLTVLRMRQAVEFIDVAVGGEEERQRARWAHHATSAVRGRELPYAATPRECYDMLLTKYEAWLAAGEPTSL